VLQQGVSGVGKSTLGAALAAATGMPFTDGDDLHPKGNVDKMAAGVPLTDADREPWLLRIRAHAEWTVADNSDGRVGSGIVVACSALKRIYRDLLRGMPVPRQDCDCKVSRDQAIVLRTCFVLIEGRREVLVERMEGREGHFMKAGMLESQLETLEDPTGEDGVMVVSAEECTDEQVRRVCAWIGLGSLT